MGGPVGRIDGGMNLLVAQTGLVMRRDWIVVVAPRDGGH